MRPVDIEQLRVFVAPVVEGLGYELVELEWKHEAGSFVLRVYVDRPPPAVAEVAPALPKSEFGLDDCERVSRSLSAELDVAELIHPRYHLEVSSPGVNRPLRSERDFARFVGHNIKVRTRVGQPVAGAAAPRRNFKGRLTHAEAGRCRVEVDGHEHEIALADVEKANLEYEFK